MIKQKIHIINCEALYNILIEIKNNLLFDPIHYKDKKEILTKLEYNKSETEKSLFLFKKKIIT
jgi:hypothetical protein